MVDIILGVIEFVNVTFFLGAVLFVLVQCFRKIG